MYWKIRTEDYKCWEILLVADSNTAFPSKEENIRSASNSMTIVAVHSKRTIQECKTESYRYPINCGTGAGAAGVSQEMGEMHVKTIILSSGGRCLHLDSSILRTLLEIVLTSHREFCRQLATTAVCRWKEEQHSTGIKTGTCSCQSAILQQKSPSSSFSSRCRRHRPEKCI